MLLQKIRRKKKKRKHPKNVHISVFPNVIISSQIKDEFGLLSLLLSPIQIRKDTE